MTGKKTLLFDILKVEQVTQTLNVWLYQRSVEIRIPTEDDLRELWGYNNQRVVSIPAEFDQNGASDIDNKVSIGSGFLLKMFIGHWAKHKPSLQRAFSISPVPFIPSLWTLCQFILEELNIFIMNQMLVTGARLTAGGGSLKCSCSSHWDAKEKSYVCWKIYRQAVHRHLFGLQKVV